MAVWPSNLQYFRRLGLCQCGKPATGWLMGPRNDVWGVACEPCSKKALAAAQKAHTP